MVIPVQKYPVIKRGYGVFIGPEGGYVFPYEEQNTVRRALSVCDNLNVQACAILAQCTGRHTVEEICDMLKTTFEDTPPDLGEQVQDLLDEAVEKGYLFYSNTPVDTKGLIQGSLDYYTPSQVLLETTTACNLQCGHCLLSAGESLKDELPVKAFIPVLTQIYTMGIKRVTLSGGELLTKKGWDILAAFCYERFSSSILTNGVLITEKVADHLSQYDDVHISLYGKDAATHEKISQVPGSFEGAVKGISLLTKKGVSVGVSVIMVPFNLHQLEDMVKLAISLKCTIVRVGIICPIGRAFDKHWELTEPQREWLDKKMNELKTKYTAIKIEWEEEHEQREDHRCGAGFTRWVITANGDVYPCGAWRIPIGNVIKDDLVAICASDAVQFLQGLQAPHQEMCGDCVYLYACKECHAHAAAHWDKVDICHWATQFKKTPFTFDALTVAR